jgi:putative aldouronate transport system permease protein
MKKKKFSNQFVDGVLIVFLFIIMLVMIVPFINIIATSLANNVEIVTSSYLLIPKHPSFSAYNYIFRSQTSTIQSLRVSGFITVLGTIISIAVTSVTAYGLSFRRLPGRKYFLFAAIFTMIFNPGMIANYLTLKTYGLLNNYASLMLPGAINVFYLMLLKNFFQEIPEDVKEAATIDGASIPGIFVRIILPLSKPALATFLLFYAVDRWNAYFDAMLYMTNPAKWPIPVVLRHSVLIAQSSGSDDVVIAPTSLRMATVMISILPILGLYPFLQRYFQSGLMAGSIKG